MIIKLKGATFSKNINDLLNSFSITYSGTGVSGTPVSIAKNADKTAAANNLEATITIGSNYTYESLTVRVGGTTLTAGTDYTVSGTGPVTLSIDAAKITGNVVVSVQTSSTGGDVVDPDDPVVPEEPETLTLHKSAIGNSILDYQDVWKMFGAGSLATLGSQIIGVDVSDYAGQQISITAAQSVISGANYAMFCSNLPNSYIQSLEQLDGYNSFGTASDYIAEDYDNLIESFNISVVAETTNTVTKTVPADAKYLFFSNLNAKCSDPLVVVGNTTGVLTTYVTEYGWSALDYNNYFYLTANSTFQSYKSKVIAVDVSNLVGETLSITATQSVVDGAYYSFFTSALPSGISSINEIDGLAYNASGKYNFTDSDLVENFVVSTEHNVTNTITKVVPTGAKYLFVATCDNYGSSEIKLA